jgi:hypothetical protein
MRNKILVAAALSVAATALAGVATAGPSAKPKQQRIAIVLHDKSNTFALSPLTSGPLRSDSGAFSACCWTSRLLTRAGQSIEIDNPTLTFRGKRGTFSWHALITFVDLNHGWTVATATWTIVHGTGAYAHLEGHGGQAFIERTDGTNTLANKAEGLVDLRGGRR